MPAKGIHHVDLAVADVERSLTFYLGLLGPLGWVEEVRYPTYGDPRVLTTVLGASQT